MSDAEHLPLPNYGPTVSETAFPSLLASGSITEITLVFEEGERVCSVQFTVAGRYPAYIVDAAGDVKLFEIFDAFSFLKQHRINVVPVDLVGLP